MHVMCAVRRPENQDLKSFVDKLAGVQQTIDDKGKIAGEILCCVQRCHLQPHAVQSTRLQLDCCFYPILSLLL